jgi:hypothetical protein
VYLEGEEEAEIAEIRASARGYLVGELGAGGNGSKPAPAPSEGAGEGARPPLVVCVVGLAHANGVLDRCAEVMLEV